MPKKEKSGGLVYSTPFGKMCPQCERALEACICSAHSVIGDGNVRVSRQTQGRSGKGVTVITGLPLNEEALKTLAKVLKQKCGVGGTVKAGVIEIQGDQRDLIVKLLHEQGFAAKKAGG
jgi:translation initiation factor 1